MQSAEALARALKVSDRDDAILNAAPAELVVAGASSVLGKITTVPVGATLYVRCPCSFTPAPLRVKWRVSCNKSFSIQRFLNRTLGHTATLTLASVLNTHAVVINGLTFTAHSTTTTKATRTFSIAGSDIEDATELVSCINDATYGVPGVTADNGGGTSAVITLTATTATALQCINTVGATIACAEIVLPSLMPIEEVATGYTNNSANMGRLFDQDVDGFPNAYIGITNNDGAAAATVVVGATKLVY